MSGDRTIIRRAERRDVEALGRLGALLLRTHHAFDPDRFLAPGDAPERGYGWFLGTQLDEPDSAVFVAERDGAVVGYVWAALEPRSWKELRDAAGFVHDIAVDETGRRSGVASALMTRALDWLEKRGAPRVVLWTAERNPAAQALFAKLGFRRTMVEMTRELRSRRS